MKDEFSSLEGVIPEVGISLLRDCLRFCPDDLRFSLTRVLQGIPSEGDALHRVFELLLKHWRGISGQDPATVAIVGPARTGKETLLEALENHQSGNSDAVFSIVDTQGLDEFLGFGRVPAEAELRRANVILLVLDAHFGLTDSTIQLHRELRKYGEPVLTIFNKIDLVEEPRRVLRQARSKLGPNVFGASSFRSATVDRLLKLIVAAAPSTLPSLSEAFPSLRRTLSVEIIRESAMAGSLIGAISLPINDLIPLVALQSAMVLKLARVFGLPLGRERAPELFTMGALGVLVWELQSKLPDPTSSKHRLLNLGLTGGWTLLVGMAAMLYYEARSNRRPDESTEKANVYPLRESTA